MELCVEIEATLETNYIRESKEDLRNDVLYYWNAWFSKQLSLTLNTGELVHHSLKFPFNYYFYSLIFTLLKLRHTFPKKLFYVPLFNICKWNILIFYNIETMVPICGNNSLKFFTRFAFCLVFATYPVKYYSTFMAIFIWWDDFRT